MIRKSAVLGRRHAVSLRANSRGVGLIEVMVSILILAIGLLGIAAMQALALRGGQGSLESSQAVMQTTSIIEAMRANRDNAASYVYSGLTSCGTVPTAGTLAQTDLNVWVNSLKSTIGTAGDSTTCANIESLGGDAYRITVQWDDSRAGGSSTRQVITETRI